MQKVDTDLARGLSFLRVFIRLLPLLIFKLIKHIAFFTVTFFKSEKNPGSRMETEAVLYNIVKRNGSQKYISNLKGKTFFL